MDRVSVTTLTKGCPLYIKLSEMYPINSSSIEASFGTWVHGAIAEGTKAILNKTPIQIDGLLMFSAESQHDPLIKQMIGDKALLSEAFRMVQNALEYITNIDIPDNVPILIEEKLEVFIREIPTIIVGILDFGYGNTIIDWKTGSFSAEEHHIQLKIYAYMAYTLGIMNPPIEVRDVYLGGDKPKVVKSQITEKELTQTHDFIVKLLKASKDNPQPHPSDACGLCEYKFRCPLYFRLSKEANIMSKIKNISQRLDHAYQYRKLGMELKSLANKLDAMANKLIDKHAELRKTITHTSAPNSIIEEKVWASGIIPLIDNLSEKEKHQLLIALLRDTATIKTEILPSSIKEKLNILKDIDRKKIRKFM